MCWSGEASTVLAAVGLGTTAWAAYKKEPTVLWLCLGYFSLMEALQAYTYSVIDQCGDPGNQVATLLGYIHIAFQPFFINAISLYFIPHVAARKIAPAAYILCFFSAVVMMLHLYPLQGLSLCEIGRPLCGDELCSVRGNWHIGWKLPLNHWYDAWMIDLDPIIRSLYIPYIFVGFVLPILYGSWRITLYHMLLGPGLAALLTDNHNEWPAVWCLLSIGILLIVVKTPIRQWLFVRHPWWERFISIGA